MRSSTQGAVLVFVVSGGLLAAVTYVQSREDEARAAAALAEDNRRAEARRAAARAASAAELRQFAAMSDSQHLAAARAAARAADRVTAQRHLNAVSPARTRDVQRVGDELAWREMQREQEQHRSQGLAEAATRDGFARNVEDAMIRDGREVESVRAEGTTLVVRYALCGRVFLNRQFGASLGDLRRAGFTRIDCRRRHSGGATWDIGR